jgi:hypothetical protein
MQYVNDDMDDLFRRAAENYPLDTSGADWKKVLTMLEGNEGKDVSEKKPNKNGRLLWLLLLLPLGLICNQLYTPSLFNNGGTTGVYQPKANTSREQNGKSGVSNESTPSTSISRDKEMTSNSQTTDDKTVKDGSKKQALASGPETAITTSSNKTQNQHRISSQKYTGRDRTTSPSQLAEEKVAEEATLAGAVSSNEQQDLNNRRYVSGVADRSGIHAPLVVANKDLTPAVTTPGVTSSQKLVMKPKKFYAGFFGGIDATTIKLQKIENAGFSYGVLAGFQLNSKWSIEMGAYVERKYYYSEGKYFNTSKIYMPPNSSISEVSGNCKMIEVPLSARYLFGVHKQSSWFGTLGLTSYFMTQENYTYDYYYGSVGPVPHTKEYNNSSTNLFSNFSLSAGYTHTLGKFAEVRIEPYFKLPLSGLGIGSLPLFSMGLQAGITKKF